MSALRPQRLDDLANDESEAINAAMDNKVHFANNIEPYRLSVAMHDDLSQSNGLARLNEERGESHDIMLEASPD